MKILIMSRKYDGVVGGVEKMSVALANDMVRRGHECHIVSLDLPGAKMYFDLDQAVVWRGVAQEDAAYKASFTEKLRRWKKIRILMQREKYDLAIGFMDGAYLSLLASAARLGLPVIAAERNAPSRFKHMSNKRAPAIAFNSFRFAKRILVQCESYREGYPPYLKDKIAVIPNPVQPVTAQPKRNNSRVLFVGRLEYQKNVASLVAAFWAISKKFPDWTLDLVGDGVGRAALEKKAQDLKIQDRVVFHGAQKNVEQYYRAADIFCMPSLFEGFPNAVAEAMAHEIPVVGYAQCLGVRDLISDGETGILAKGSFDPESLSAALAELMGDELKRVEMGRKGAAAMKQYTPGQVFNLWENVLLECCKSRAVR